MTQLQRLIDAMVDSFPDDPTQPSVVFSRLPSGSYYGSLVRYAEAYGKGKQVLFKCEGSLDEVFSQLGTMLGVSDGTDSERTVVGDAEHCQARPTPETVEGPVEPDPRPDAGGEA